jgi:protein tyrosine phosphatase (PTP) superfamily phosphohydrolase (DUF442 family)
MSIFGFLGSNTFPSLATGRRHALALLALASLAITGCQGLGNCGGGSCGGGNPCREPNALQRLGQRVFNRQPRGMVVDGCEPGLIGAAPVGAGQVITTPGAAAADESAPVELLPAEPSGPAGTNPSSSAPGNNNSGTTGSRAGAGKAVYETYKPNGGPAMARRNSTSQPAVGAKGGSQTADPLANLPRLDSPSEFESTPAVAPDASELSNKSEPNEPGGTEPAVSLAPGFRSFKVVEPRLSAGSLPGERGWAWLADQGYKTVVDLRPSAEIRSEDVATINAAGLRYLALPTTDASLDNAEHLARFATEIAHDDARPLYFFDTDGARASVIWYLHLVLNKKTAPKEAARLAQEIGPHNDALWVRADAAIAKLQPAPPSSPSTTSTPASDQAAPPSTTPGQQTGQVPSVGNIVSELFLPRPSDSRKPDPTAWKPFAALAAAGFAVPLAFMGRSALSRVVLIRANLPAPERRLRSIASASGV